MNDLLTPKTKNGFTPLMRFEFPENMGFDFSEDCIATAIRRMHVSILDDMEDMLVAEIVSAARSMGATDVFVLDKKFIFDAIREKMEREGFL